MKLQGVGALVCSLLMVGCAHPPLSPAKVVALAPVTTAKVPVLGQVDFSSEIKTNILANMDEIDAGLLKKMIEKPKNKRELAWRNPHLGFDYQLKTLSPNNEFQLTMQNERVKKAYRLRVNKDAGDYKVILVT